jgi:hypothetical protein
MWEFAMKSVWMNVLAWVAAVAAALSLAFASPSESSVMGKLPMVVAQPANRQPVRLPAELPAERTLAVLTFSKNHRESAEEWINGLQLRDAPGIRWIRMPVIEDPGSDSHRAEVQARLLSRYSQASDIATLWPVFTKRDEFLRAAAVASTDAVQVLVLNRYGDILARAEGAFDADKAIALRETLLSQDM